MLFRQISSLLNTCMVPVLTEALGLGRLFADILLPLNGQAHGGVGGG